MNKSSIKKLHAEISLLLEKALQNEAEVSYQDGMIKLIISRENFENSFGALLHRIQHLIDERYPNRATDIAILIRDSRSRFEHLFKIWHTSKHS